MLRMLYRIMQMLLRNFFEILWTYMWLLQMCVSPYLDSSFYRCWHRHLFELWVNHFLPPWIWRVWPLIIKNQGLSDSFSKTELFYRQTFAFCTRHVHLVKFSPGFCDFAGIRFEKSCLLGMFFGHGKEETATPNVLSLFSLLWMIPDAYNVHIMFASYWLYHIWSGCNQSLIGWKRHDLTSFLGQFMIREI